MREATHTCTPSREEVVVVVELLSVKSLKREREKKGGPVRKMITKG